MEEGATFDQRLAERVRRVLRARRGVTERRMFGGLTFLVRGHMCCGVVGDDLVIRVGPEHYKVALSRPHARPMDFTGRPLKGFVYVGPNGHRTDQALARWVRLAAEFASSLPSKQAQRRGTRKATR